MKGNEEIIPIEIIKSKIHLIRDTKVILDSDLAELYGVPTKRLNEQVKRNIDRFPDDFMFRLSEEEFEALRPQNATSKKGGRRYSPYAFTEQGVAMLSSALNSERAIKVNISIMRTFVKLQEYALSFKEIEKRVEALEKRNDAQFKIVFDALRQIFDDKKVREKKEIGFIKKETSK